MRGFVAGLGAAELQRDALHLTALARLEAGAVALCAVASSLERDSLVI
jgi:hypothetical protein